MSYEVEEVQAPVRPLVINFLFTSTLVAMKRGDAQSLVKSRGGIAASGVSKNLDYLVMGDAGSAGSKLKKAEALGVPS